MRTGTPGAPPVRPRRLAAGGQYTAAALTLFLALVGSHLATPLYPKWQQDFGLSTTDITLIFASYPVAVTISLLFGGKLADQLGRKPLVLTGLLLNCLSCLVYIIATGAAYLVVARLINGLAIGLLSGPAVAAIVELHPRQDRAAASRVGAIATLAAPAFGLLFATLVVYFASPETSVTLPFYVLSCALALAIVLLGSYRETILPENHKPLSQVSFAPQTLVVPPEIRTALALSIAVAVLAWCTTGLWLALGPTLVEQVIQSTSQLTGGLTVVFFLSTAGIVQLLARRLQYLNAILWSVYLAIPSLALINLTLFLQNAPGLVLGVTIAGASQGLGWMGGMELVNNIAPPHMRASVLSVLYFCGYLGGAVPIVFTGLVADSFGLFFAVASLSAVLFLLAVFIGISARRFARRGLPVMGA